MMSSAARDPDAERDPAEPTGSTGALDLRQLRTLRWIAIAVELALVIMAGRWFGSAVAIAPALAICIAQAGLNGISARRMRRRGQPLHKQLFVQLLIDIAALTGIAYFAGGSTNPLITLYLPLVAIGATILPPRMAAALAAISVACYTGVAAVHREIHIHDPQSAFQAHLAGMWLIFVVSALIIVWFVVRMAATIRDRDAALGRAREAALRNDRVVALGNLAAGAAHELGTPLATMAVLAGELAQRPDCPADARADARLIAAQVQECKRIVSQLTARAGQPRVEELEVIAGPVADWVTRVVERWRRQRPSAVATLDLRGALPGPRVAGDPAVEQAMLSLFNNAADASPDQVAIDTRWERAELRVEVLDRGPGIPAQIEARLGREPVSTRGAGRGYGVILARSAIERLGGSLSFGPRSGGGTTAQMRIPLAAIAVADRAGGSPVA